MQLAARTKTEELADALYVRVRDLTRLVRHEATSEFSVTAVSVLGRLRDDGPQRITALADAEHVAQPTMTNLVGRLEARGLVSRGPDPDDRRAVRVALTDEGARRLAEVARDRARVLAERLGAMPPDARARIAAALPDLDLLIHPEGPTA
jgi:DNA-binding MarR family transcriptional regulator